MIRSIVIMIIAFNLVLLIICIPLTNAFAFGGSGLNQLYGNAADDVIFGSFDDDFISAGNGQDELYGGEGDDGCKVVLVPIILTVEEALIY
jgi:Ca2+-binding RTX toxin-like protein